MSASRLNVKPGTDPKNLRELVRKPSERKPMYAPIMTEIEDGYKTMGSQQKANLARILIRAVDEHLGFTSEEK